MILTDNENVPLSFEQRDFKHYALLITHVSDKQFYVEDDCYDKIMAFAHAAIQFPLYANKVKVWETQTGEDKYVWNNPDIV